MRNLMRILGPVAALLMLVAATARGQTPAPDNDNYQYDYDKVKIDRYLDVEVWPDHSDEEYYSGDNITIYFRASRDCFVSIYSIDTRGRVNLLFPAEPGQDNFIYGGITYRLPGENDDYDLEVTGPEGFEYLQIIASREKIDVPNWYHNSGLVSDAADMNEYMDYLNTNYFVRYNGQRFAFDRASIYVNEWEQYYFRPVYMPYYPSWTVYGNCYIDYPWGSTVYINGVYWGCTPLYIPRLVVGWHTITIYDRWHHCWESDFHVSRYNTMVFNRTEINPQASVKSKYKEVQTVGYRDPAKNGYPDFETRKTVVTKEMTGTPMVGKTTRGTSPGKTSGVVTASDDFVLPKTYVHGTTKVVKTDRGYETDGATTLVTPRTKPTSGTYRKSPTSGGSSGSGQVPPFTGRTKSSGGSSGGTVTKSPSSSRGSSGSVTKNPTSSGGSSSGSYRKISGSSSSAAKQGSSSKKPASSGSSGAKVEKKQSGSGGSSSGTVQKKSPAPAPKGNSGGKSSSGGNVKQPSKPSQGNGNSGGKGKH